MRRIIAFTLSEVLIVVLIMGIVAVMTIPTVISNYKKHIVETKLKKDYALFTQVFKSAEAEYGFSQTWDISDGIEGCKDFFYKYMKPFLKVDKVCIPSSSDCWSDNVVSLSGIGGYLANKPDLISFILQDGQSVLFWSARTNGVDDVQIRHIQFFIDIDGKDKGKNMLGADIFHFGANFETSIFVPQGAGVEGADNPSACADTNHMYAGRYCAGLIMENNWKIPDDYPVKF